MKYLSILLICFISCKTLSQKKSNKYIVDINLENDFFTNRPIYSIESSDSIFFDSVFVAANKKLYPDSEIANSFIRDLNNNHYPFYNCKSIFIKDTLFMEFFDSSPILSDRLKIRIVGGYFTAEFAIDDTLIKGEPKRLIFKESLKNTKDLIAGEMEIIVKDPKTQNEYLFSGPFLVPISRQK